MVQGAREWRGSETKQSPTPELKSKLREPTVSPFIKEQETLPKQSAPQRHPNDKLEEQSLKELSLKQLRRKYVEHPIQQRGDIEERRHNSIAEVEVQPTPSGK